MYTNNDQYDKMPRHELIEELKSWNCKHERIKALDAVAKQQIDLHDLLKYYRGCTDYLDRREADKHNGDADIYNGAIYDAMKHIGVLK